MLDLKLIQDDPDALDAMLRSRRSSGLDTSELKALIENTRQTRAQLDELRAERNSASKEIGKLMQAGQKDEAEQRKAEVAGLGDRISELENQHAALEARLTEIVAALPNWLHPETPDGASEEDNVELRQEGAIRDYDFTPKPHYELGEGLGVLDFESGVRLAGSRFYAYRGLAARLERALINFMLDLHTTRYGYEEAWVPSLITDEGMYTTGQFPKFRGEYYTLERDGLSLIPTAEVPLVNLYRDQILDEDQLPVRLTAASSCFRREAGAAGKDTRGLVRVHQFQKVELVQICKPEDSEAIHEQMREHAESVLRELGLPYRVLQLCSGDIGQAAAKTYDLEVWMPGLNRYLEISSISNCWDYQARRGLIRYKGKEKKSRTVYAHTLNGSGLAAGRCMIAIMENYQKRNGSFDVPEVLQPYMDRSY